MGCAVSPSRRRCAAYDRGLHGASRRAPGISPWPGGLPPAPRHGRREDGRRRTAHRAVHGRSREIGAGPMTDLPPSTVPTPAATAAPARTSTPLLVASTLCWIWAVLAILVALAFGLASAAIGMSAGLAIAVIFLFLAGFYATAGNGIRRRKQLAAVVGVPAAAVDASPAGIGRRV